MDGLNKLIDEDDGTSCTSSLATTLTLSEDNDDLRLGAEANSFDDAGKKEETKSLERVTNRVQRNLIIARNQSSIDSAETTYSSICSVVDLLKARECNATEVLNNLGFCGKSVDQTRTDILARFTPAPFNTRVTKTNNQGDVTDEVTKSINKTEEWLLHHHDDDDVKSKTGDVKKAAPQWTKNRRRFSAKSRQSSFDLLPKVNEESSEVSHSANRPIALKNLILHFNQPDSFELEEINSNNDPGEIKSHRPIVTTPPPPNGESDGTSSGFDEDIATVANHHDDDITRVSPSKVVETYKPPCFCGSHDVTTDVRYVYDVTLGEPTNSNCNSNILRCHARSSAQLCVITRKDDVITRKDDVITRKDDVITRNNDVITRNNDVIPRNNRNNDAVCKKNDVTTSRNTDFTSRCNDVNTLINDVTSGGADTSLTKTDLIISNDDVSPKKDDVKLRRSEVRRRRREFADQSAISGDSISDISRSSIVRRGGSVFSRRPRIGTYDVTSSSVPKNSNCKINRRFASDCTWGTPDAEVSRGNDVNNRSARGRLKRQICTTVLPHGGTIPV